MEETLALIDQLIEEHKQILQRFQTAEQVANDAVAILELRKILCPGGLVTRGKVYKTCKSH